MMINFNIQPLSNEISKEVQSKIDNKTKPIGALGRLEEVASQICLIQNTVSPSLNNPTIILFAGDHGIALEGVVNLYPQEVTRQMVFNFLNGGAAINVLARQNDIEIKVVDAGVNWDFSDDPKLVNAKIAKGTKNFLYESAMTKDQCILSIERGAEIVKKVSDEGCNVIGFGEMGIGNTSSAAIIMSLITKIPLEECVGKGTGLDDQRTLKKLQVLAQAIKKYPAIVDPIEVLSTFGGFEIAMICGAMLKAAELKMVLLIDGFIATSALLIASNLYPDVLGYCIFSHCSDEKGHQKMLEYLNAQPLLNLGMRLGEGTGAAVAYPLLKSSVNFLNEMASFDSAKVSKV